MYEEKREEIEKQKTEIRSRKPRMAICYDFDKTLSPDDMQTFTLFPSFGVDSEDFWRQTNELAREQLMDSNLAWMYQLLQYSQFMNKSMSRDYFHKIGAEVKLYNGVEKWFDRMDQYAEKNGIILEHYIISSGLKELIEGSAIADKFARIYASSYYYNADGIAKWPAQAVNYTNKTQFIFRIAKGIFEEWDDSVNDTMPEDELRIPYENIIYIGDSLTDIPCMRLVKSKGGYSIGVFDPDKDNRRKVYQLYNDGRISFFAPADYSSKGELFRYVKQIIDTVAAREAMHREQLLLKCDADLYKMYEMAEMVYSSTGETVSKKRMKEMQEERAELKALISGNID